MCTMKFAHTHTHLHSACFCANMAQEMKRIVQNKSPILQQMVKYLHKQKKTNKSRCNTQLTQKDGVHFANKTCPQIKK